MDISFHTPNFVSLQFLGTHHHLALASNLENNSTFDNKDCSPILQFKAFSALNIGNHSNAHSNISSPFNDHSSYTKEPPNTPLNISHQNLFEYQQHSHFINYLKSDCSKSSVSN